MRQTLFTVLLLSLVLRWLRSDQILYFLSFLKLEIDTDRGTADQQNFNRVSLHMAVYDQFILFGDSLIQHSSSQERGFALTPGLQAEYIRRLDVVNRGFSGYNTDQALRMLPTIIPAPENAKVRFLLIFFGANDACLKNAQGGQHVPLDRFKKNMISIVTHPSVKKQRPRIILVTTPPMNEYAAEENDRTKGITEPRRSADHTRLYAEAVKEVSETTGVALLDLWTLFMTHAGWEEGQYPLPGSKTIPPNSFMRMLLHDGLHFTGLAYTLFQQELMRVIIKTWPDQAPEKLPFVLPMWNEPSQWEAWENT